jgi:uncharacterized Fe-S cluster protein YjdI
MRLLYYFYRYGCRLQDACTLPLVTLNILIMAQKTFKYSNGDVTVVWKPDVCIHSGICVKGLPGVFDAKRSPWIDTSQADTDAIVEQVKKCPSGALSYIMNNEQTNTGQPVAEAAQITNIEIIPNGPIAIKNECHIKHSDGREEIKQGKIFLCRCGHSKNKPYCDGSHKREGFVG